MTGSSDNRSTLTVGNRSYEYWSFAKLPQDKVARLPYSLKILLENLLRYQDGLNVTQDDIDVAGNILPNGTSVALILFEHKWAVRLNDAVGQVNATTLRNAAASRELAAEIEHLLVLGSGSGVSYCSTNTSI